MLLRIRFLTWAVVGLSFLSGVFENPAVAAQRTWIGGDNDWIDGGSTANWNPADEPDADDEAVFNTSNAVEMGSGNDVNGLTMSGGINLSTNGNDLSVGGLVQLSGAGTNLFVAGAASELTAHDVIINSDSTVELSDATFVVDESALLASGVFTINAGGELAGHGTVQLADSPIVAATLLNNSGTLTALSRPANILLPPPVGTLTIDGGGALARFDLDGSGESGIVNVNRNQTLEVNLAPADALNGSLNFSQESRLDMVAPWTLGVGGTINVNNGAVGGIPGVPAGTATIAGETLSQTGGTITVVDSDGTLAFDAPFSMTGGTFTNSGLVIFNADASINVSNFDFDAGDWTIQNDALFTVNVTDYDPGVATNGFDAVITLDNADISVVTGDAEFVMSGTLNMVSTAENLVTAWSGEPVDVGNDIGTLDAHVNVSGSEISRFAAQVDFNADADVEVAAGATLDFTNAVNFDTANGLALASFSGAGTLSFNQAVNVHEILTLNMVGGTVDLDGGDAVGDLIDIEAQLVINAATLAGFGRFNSGGGVNAIQIDALNGTGSLTVNLDDPDAEWTLNPLGAIAFVSTNALLTLLSGSDVNLDGSASITGTVGWAARVDIGGTVNLLTAAPNGGLLLQGGSLGDPNTIAGGVINGPGELLALNNRALVGFGTIHAPIDFEGTATLRAEIGTLILNGVVSDVGTLGTAGTGILHVTNAWDSVVADAVTLDGGELRGGTLTIGNTNGVTGHGLVSARVINNERMAADGGTLVVETAANDNDWDGLANDAQLRAFSGSMLELRDNLPFGFGGSMIGEAGATIFTNGFGLDCNPGSTIDLTAATLRSTGSTDIGGDLVVHAGADSTLEVEVNRFLDFEDTSTTLLNGNLRLVSNNATIAAGAAFTGPGALILADASHLTADAGADIDVLLDMQGTFRPAGFDAIGRVDLRDYQQSETGELIVELTGTGLNQFDRLVVNGDVLLDGLLTIDIDGGFVPSPGDSFVIISGNSVTGTFDLVQVVDLPAGLIVEVNDTPSFVQLVVVATPPGDLDGDLDVDIDDWFTFAECMNGPEVNVVPFGCSLAQFQNADIDDDADVDLEDFEKVQGCFSGDGVDADPACAAP